MNEIQFSIVGYLHISSVIRTILSLNEASDKYMYIYACAQIIGDGEQITENREQITDNR